MGLHERLGDAIAFAKNAGNDDIMQKLIDAQTQIIKLQERMLNYQDMNQQLRDENASLRNSLEISDDVITIEGYVYIKNNPMNRGPFCLVCWEKNRKLIPIVLYNSKVQTLQSFRRISQICDACGAEYGDLPSEQKTETLLGVTSDSD